MKIVDLNEILLTEEAVATWKEIARRFVAFLVDSGKVTSQEEIPYEQIRLEDDGTLTLFVKVKGVEINMTIPPDHWSWRQ